MEQPMNSGFWLALPVVLVLGLPGSEVFEDEDEEENEPDGLGTVSDPASHFSFQGSSGFDAPLPAPNQNFFQVDETPHRQ